MTKNPFLNALAALVYIILVVLGMTAISGVQNDFNMYIMPVMVISLFTLSAAVMGYIFCYQPLRLYLDGKKEQAVKLFLQTVGIFACILLVMIVVYFLVIKF